MRRKIYQVMVTYYNLDGTRNSCFLRAYQFYDRNAADSYARRIEATTKVAVCRARSVYTKTKTVPTIVTPIAE